MHAVLRCLHDYLVADSVLIIQPEIGRGRCAAGQGDRHGVGDVAFCEAGLVGYGAVGVDRDSRGRCDLLHMNIHRAWNAL